MNTSFADFEVKDGAVLYALGALKNVGVDAMRHVVDIREADGPFKDLFDFAKRVDTRIVNKRAFENLARGGAFDDLEPNRARSLASAATLQSIGARAAQERASAQNSLFGGAAVEMAEPDLPETPLWNMVEQLDHELGAIGFYLGGHPLEAYDALLERKKVVMSLDIEERYRSGSRAMRLAGVVRKRQERMSKRNKRFAYVSLSDPTGDYEIFVGEDILNAHRDILVAGALIVANVAVDERDGELKIFTNGIESLELRTELSVKGIQVRLRSATPEQLDKFKSCLDGLKDVPFEKCGFLDVIIPLGHQREGHWRVAGKFGIDDKIQKAIKATQIVETIEEIAA